MGKWVEGSIDLLPTAIPLKGICKELGWAGFHAFPAIFSSFHWSISNPLCIYHAWVYFSPFESIDILAWSLNMNDFFITYLSFCLWFITNYSYRQAYVEINRSSHLLFLIISIWLSFAFLTALLIGLKSLFLSFFFSETVCIRTVVLKSVVPGPVPSALPRNRLEMQLWGPGMIYYSNKPCRWSSCRLKFENHSMGWKNTELAVYILNLSSSTMIKRLCASLWVLISSFQFFCLSWHLWGWRWAILFFVSFNW